MRTTPARDTPAGGRWSREDTVFMGRALALARRGGGRTSPNPRVGAVLVRQGRVVGEGYHAALGGPHAEAVALERAGGEARGATLYVTLEPCNHQGRTPPCSPRLIEAGLARVVAPLSDPDPRVGGKGFARLRETGIRVEVGLGAAEGIELNRGYLHRVTTGRPYVSLKVASTLDGGISGLRPGDPRITGAEAKRHAHALRARVQGILIGRGTLEADVPRLDARASDDPEYVPLRMVLDRTLRFPEDSRWTREGRGDTVVVFHGPGADPSRTAALRRRGVRTCEVAVNPAGRLDPDGVLAWAGDQGLNEILVEGGAAVLDSFLSEGRFQRLYHYVSPRLGGEDGLRWYRGPGPPVWQGDRPLRTVGIRELGEDLLRVLTRGWEEEYLAGSGGQGRDA
jgi:diaminohydroxyphosphoribosylaminopyrimidine deaminase/5-amino-6-(5-phosphoribosylamino)uracil reductase